MTVYQILAVWFLAFFAFAFVWPSWRVWRRDGINPLVLPRDDSAHGLVGRWFKGLVAATAAYTGALAAGLDPAWFGHLAWLDAQTTRIAGGACLVVSLPLVVMAQRSMGKSWRIGIDGRTPGELVTGGIFARSRNPIFLGMRLGLLGLLLTAPTGASLAIFLLGEALVGIQVRLEEAFLTQTGGTAYAAYREAVPRWL